MSTSVVGVTASSHRLARNAWMVGGIIALFGAVCLLVAVEGRAWRLASRAVVQRLFHWHDVALLLQSVVLIPFSMTLSRFGASPSRGLLLSAAGAGSLMTMALLMFLYLTGAVTFGPADTFYMLPQAVLGIWVATISRQLANRSRAIGRLGLISGAGLILVGASLLLVIVYFGPAALGGTIRDRSASGQLVNRLSHIMLRIGSYPGRLGFPLWTLLVWRTFAQSIESRAASGVAPGRT